MSQEAIYVVGKTVVSAQVALKRDVTLGPKVVDKTLDLRFLPDGDWYRLAGLRNYKVVLCPGYEEPKDWTKLMPLLAADGAFLRVIGQPLPGAPS